MKKDKTLKLSDLPLPLDVYFSSLSLEKEGSDVLKLKVKNYCDLLFKMESLLNVCILALDNPNIDANPHIVEPAVNIQSVLEMAIQMIPFPEAEFLDGVKKEVLSGEGVN